MQKCVEYKLWICMVYMNEGPKWMRKDHKIASDWKTWWAIKFITCFFNRHRMHFWIYWSLWNWFTKSPFDVDVWVAIILFPNSSWTIKFFNYFTYLSLQKMATINPTNTYFKSIKKNQYLWVLLIQS